MRKVGGKEDLCMWRSSLAKDAIRFWMTAAVRIVADLMRGRIKSRDLWRPFESTILNVSSAAAKSKLLLLVLI